MNHHLKRAGLMASALVLAACGGGGSGTIGGTVAGLGSGASVVLQNTDTTTNTTQTLTLSGNGKYTFGTSLSHGDGYSVVVSQQPSGQSCSVVNSTGTVDSAGENVTNVNVTCSYTASIGGVLSGLKSGYGVVLQNASQTLALAANGVFVMPGLLTPGTTYNVFVATQPAAQSCTVINGTGTVQANTLASVTVNCI